MNPITNNEFLAAVMEEAAWKEASESGPWSMEMLSKYQDKVDWKKISSNSEVVWTVDGVNKFKHKINWEEFSANCPAYFLTVENLQQFKNFWDWSEISERSEVLNNWELLDTLVDSVDWEKIIEQWSIERPIEFFKRYESHVPMKHFQDSRLWNMIADELGKQLKLRIMQ